MRVVLPAEHGPTTPITVSFSTTLRSLNNYLLVILGFKWNPDYHPSHAIRNMFKHTKDSD